MATTTLRPSSDSSTGLSAFGSGTGNYGRVNEATADDTNGVSIATNSAQDIYNLDDPSLSGTITNVEVFARAWRTTTVYEVLRGSAKIGVRVGSTNYLSAAKAINTGATQVSQSWATNPNTSAAWTWAEINALLAIIYLETGQWSDVKNSGYLATYASQVWVVVTYTPAANCPISLLKTKFMPLFTGGL